MLPEKDRKHIHKTLCEKCQAFKDIENELPSRDMAANMVCLKNTISRWLQNIEFCCDQKKGKIHQKLRAGAHEVFDEADLEWFLNL